MKTIKRYANRRLYDSDSSKTITLEDIAEFIKDGEQVQIVDNVTGNDITTKILGQVFLKVNLGGGNSEFNQYLLTSLIREGSRNIQGLFERLVEAGVGAANLTRDRIEKMVDDMVRQGQMSAGERGDFINDLLQKAAKKAGEFREEVETRARDFINMSSADTIETLSSKVDELSHALKELQKNHQENPSEKKTSSSGKS